jgi:hypothetical protein|tara:strand:- start:810 stop:926 length:117 start_codon:yes stop_codon:yes gene_type:complete
MERDLPGSKNAVLLLSTAYDEIILFAAASALSAVGAGV